MQKYNLSVRKLATLLGVNPSSVVHWQTERNAIAPKNAELLNTLEKKIQTISKNDGLSSEQVLDILIALSKTPLWKGIASAPDFFHSEKELSLTVDLTKAVKDDLDKIEKGLRVVDKSGDVKLEGIDLRCKDSQGKTTLIMVKAGALHETVFGDLVSRLADIKDTLGKDFRIIILAYEFTPAFVRAASQIPALKLKKLSVKTDIKTSDV